ncbi:hypothetical protein K438DRAFT_1989358 [Mycena galopus ATCC 62051]|nr:hypothetical protein K438DRAFT_1989358 [Mycena galopus ATCC 62051]
MIWRCPRRRLAYLGPAPSPPPDMYCRPRRTSSPTTVAILVVAVDAPVHRSDPVCMKIKPLAKVVFLLSFTEVY